MNGERTIEPDVLGIFAQKPRADRVESAGPSQGIRHDARLAWEYIPRDPLHPAGHLDGCPAGKGHQHDPARIGALDDEMSNTMGKRVGFARPRPCHDEERRSAVLSSTTLFWVERGQMRRWCHWGRRIANPTSKHGFWQICKYGRCAPH